MAVQEVDGIAAAERIFAPAIYSFHFAVGGGAQEVGFAYRKALQNQGFTVKPLPDYDALTLGGSLRPGALLEISAADKTVTLMNIHLKARCPDNNVPLFESDKRDCQRLAAQVPLLEDWIDEQASQDKPIIVLGDFNRRFEAPDRFWPEIDDGVPANADLSRVTEDREGKCWPERRLRTFIDHIVYDQLTSQMILADSVWQHRFLTEHQTYEDVLSDHCPLSVDVQF
ncbi:MAG: endonuclease/exonuclease/phosphatase family protein [Chloroflexota bacterium]